MSTMASTCSMSTGHCSTHEPQVVHDHSTSGPMGLGTRVWAPAAGPGGEAPSDDASPARASSRDDEENMLSRRFMITSLGESGLPVFHAGQTDWQRPHSVHVTKSSICFHVKFSMKPAP